MFIYSKRKYESELFQYEVALYFTTEIASRFSPGIGIVTIR